jgi:outer membrane protein assembly factor BamB
MAMASTPDELQGWKEIAAYLGRSVRAAQRWEQQYGLPVRRLSTPTGAIVYARRAEIDAWKAGLGAHDANALQSDVDEVAQIGADVPDERDESVARIPVAGIAPATPGAPGSASAVPSRPPAERAGSRLLRRLAVALLVAVSASGLLWVLRGGSSRDTQGLEPAALSAEDPAAADWGRRGLDEGPWPVNGHDSRRTNRSHLRGPASPAVVRRVFDPGGNVPQHEFIATSEGFITGTCAGDVVAFDAAGRERWRMPLDRSDNPEAPSAFGGAPDALYVAVADCPHPPTTNARTQTTAIKLDTGGTMWRFRTALQHTPPAILPDRTLVQMDAYNTLRSLTGVGGPRWILDFPGFSHGAAAQGRDGTLYVPTDGGPHGHKSLWAVSPDGRILWGAGVGSFVRAAVGSDGSIYVYDVPIAPTSQRLGPDVMRAFAGTGSERWSLQLPTDLDADAAAESPSIAGSGALVVVAAGVVMSLDPANGTVRWKRQMNTPRSGPRVAVLDVDDNVYLPAGDDVVSLSPSGAERWRVPLPGATRLLIGGDGMLAALVNGREIWAIEDAVRADVTAR